MHTPHFKFLVSTLTAFALGVALCAAWFLAQSPPAPTPPSVVAASIKISGNGSESESAATPWKSRDVKREIQPTGEKKQEESPVTIIRMLRGIFAQRKHEARTRALRMSSWLGLDSPQAASLEAFLLDNGADGVLVLPSDLELWVKANLRPEQAEAYARYQESCRRTEAEANALAEVHRISQAMELKEEQRDAIFERAYGIYLLSAEASSPQEFFQRDNPRQANEPSWIGIGRSLIDGLYRSVLTMQQVDAYGSFLSKQQELEKILEKEAE